MTPGRSKASIKRIGVFFVFSNKGWFIEADFFSESSIFNPEENN
jgi:hypothetical protein